MLTWCAYLDTNTPSFNI